jgi:hypothetical protein
MGYENKYGKITTEYGDIPADEPVILFRARDSQAIYAIQEYLDCCSAAHCTPQHVEGIQAALDKFTDYQDKHPELVRLPGERHRT